PASNRLCYMLNVYKGLDAGDPPTAAHIHVGAEGASGRPVVPLATPASGAAGACVVLEADVARALADNPRGYYVNVHTAAYPAGARRGQLRGWRGCLAGRRVSSCRQPAEAKQDAQWPNARSSSHPTSARATTGRSTARSGSAASSRARSAWSTCWR